MDENALKSNVFEGCRKDRKYNGIRIKSVCQREKICYNRASVKMKRHGKGYNQHL